MPDPQTNLGGAPTTMGPVGFWLDKDGNVAATDPSGKPQVTPGQRDNPQSAIYYDAQKDLDYNLVNGQKVYQSPVAYDGTKTVFKQSKSGPPISDTGGGAFHGHPQWNPKDGKWDVGLDMGKILSWAAAAGISAGVITAAMGPTAAGTSALGPSTAANMAATQAGLLPPAALAATSAAAAGAGAAAGGAAGAGAGPTAATAGGATVPPVLGSRPTVPPATPGMPGGSSWDSYGGNNKSSGGGGVPNWLLDTALRSAVPVIGNLVGAHMTSTGIREAAEIQAKSTAEALKFEKQKYGELVGRLDPYVQAGTTSADRMAQLLGLPSRQGTTAAPWPGPAGPPPTQSAGPPRVTTQPAAPPQPGPTSSGQTVLMRSPDGKETQPVPMADVEHWKSLGAVPLGNA